MNPLHRMPQSGRETERVRLINRSENRSPPWCGRHTASGHPRSHPDQRSGSRCCRKHRKLELTQPGVGILTGHIVVGVIAGNHHQRAQDDLGVARSLNSLDHVLAGSLFRLALNGANEHIVVARVCIVVCIWL